MAIDIVARGLAMSLVGDDGRVTSNKMPQIQGTSELTGFTSVGKLTDPSLVEGKTAEEILMMILYGVSNPTLTNPKLSIALNDDNEALIIGREGVVKGALVFDRGSINPAYGTSGYRAGSPMWYTVGEESIESSSTQLDFTLTIVPDSADIQLSYSVAYGAGEQPLNSVGQKYDSALPSGVLSGSIALNAAYALYDEEGEEKTFTWFESEDGSGYLSTFSAETATDKQSFAVSTKTTVIGIQAYNALTQRWEWLGGETAAVSLTYFDTEVISGESLGESVDYIKYTHNQARTGERELRIYIQ